MKLGAIIIAVALLISAAGLSVAILKASSRRTVSTVQCQIPADVTNSAFGAYVTCKIKR